MSSLLHLTKLGVLLWAIPVCSVIGIIRFAIVNSNKQRPFYYVSVILVSIMVWFAIPCLSLLGGYNPFDDGWRMLYLLFYGYIIGGLDVLIFIVYEIKHRPQKLDLLGQEPIVLSNYKKVISFMRIMVNILGAASIPFAYYDYTTYPYQGGSVLLFLLIAVLYVTIFNAVAQYTNRLINQQKGKFYTYFVLMLAVFLFTVVFLITLL